MVSSARRTRSSARRLPRMQWATTAPGRIPHSQRPARISSLELPTYRPLADSWLFGSPTVGRRLNLAARKCSFGPRPLAESHPGAMGKKRRPCPALLWRPTHLPLSPLQAWSGRPAEPLWCSQLSFGCMYRTAHHRGHSPLAAVASFAPWPSFALPSSSLLPPKLSLRGRACPTHPVTPRHRSHHALLHRT